MAGIFCRQLRGFSILFCLNLKHYAGAIWGIGLTLDPDYPDETRFRADLVVDAVLEYRGYGLFAVWCVILAKLVYWPVLSFLAGLWAFMAWKRAYFYTTAYRFWTEAYEEAPRKSRNQTRYAEELMLEIERRLKAGTSWDSPELTQLINRATEIQNIICGRSFELPKDIL